MDELALFLKRIEDRSRPKPYVYKDIVNDLLNYEWICPHCGITTKVSVLYEFADNGITTVDLKYICYNCGRNRYEKFNDIIEENGEAYIEE